MRHTLRSFCLIWGVAVLLLASQAQAQAQAAIPPAAPAEVVFLVPQDIGEAELAELRQALLAQFAGTDTTVLIERADQDLADLRAQVQQARSAAIRSDALGVFWLDSASQGDWLLYLAEPSGDRVLVRRIALSTVGAAFEAVAVITQRSASALASGETIGMRPVQMAEPPPSQPLPRQPPPSRPRSAQRPPPKPGPAKSPTAVDTRLGVPVVQLGYRGETYSAQRPWQSGAALSAGFLWVFGLYSGGGVGLFAPLAVEDELADFEVRRLPCELTLGWRSRTHPVSVGAQLAAVLDVVRRQVLVRAESVAASPLDRRVALGVSPRVRIDVRTAPLLGFYAQAGVHVVLNNFAYIAQIDDSERTLMEPFPVRFIGEVGLTFGP